MRLAADCGERRRASGPYLFRFSVLVLVMVGDGCVMGA